MKDPKHHQGQNSASESVRTLLLIRHAKSSWDNAAINDFDRPLNERGKRDAPMMARRILDKKISIDTIVSSPAKRARRTAVYFAEQYGLNESNLIFKTELYAAPQLVFYDVIRKLDNSINHLALFSHNPGITEFANSLTPVHIDNMPTCAIFGIKLTIKDWNDFRQAKKEFWFFDYPKLID